MLSIQNLDAVVFSLRNQAKRYGPPGRAEVQVGYRAHYAIYVHEDLSAYHPNGQAKYLEEPARRFGPQMGKIFKSELSRRGGTVRGALVESGAKLLAESRKLVPVKTGFLRDSGFVSITG